MQWARTVSNGRKPLQFFEEGTVTGGQYCTEILEWYVLIFCSAVSPDYVFIDDNTSPHRSARVVEVLESEGILRVGWSVYSPDLIKHSWGTLGRRVAQRRPPPRILQDLITPLKEVRHNISMKLLSSLGESIFNISTPYCNTWIAVYVGYTPYWCEQICQHWRGTYIWRHVSILFWRYFTVFFCSVCVHGIVNQVSKMSVLICVLCVCVCTCTLQHNMCCFLSNCKALCIKDYPMIFYSSILLASLGF